MGFVQQCIEAMRALVRVWEEADVQSELGRVTLNYCEITFMFFASVTHGD